jgi:hypothetical protein
VCGEIQREFSNLSLRLQTCWDGGASVNNQYIALAQKVRQIAEESVLMPFGCAHHEANLVTFDAARFWRFGCL